MAHQLVLEFTGVTESDYWSVNEQLGLARDLTGDWPVGIQTHAAGFADDGTFVVTEVWDSKEAQADFMEARLGPALHQVGLPAPSRITWIELFTQHTI